ncbi:MAG TPA: glutamate-cysteine ligase family protein [Micromonosporaceae bacterium]
MGKAVASTSFTRLDFQTYRRKVRRCLDVFAQMLDHFQFDEDRPMTGLEIEINLVDLDGHPAMRNTEVLTALGRSDFQSELGLFNLEFNAPPRLLPGAGLAEYEHFLRDSLNEVETRAKALGLGLVLIGTLPTVNPSHTVLTNISSNPRYRTLNDRILDARGDDLTIDIRGPERLQVDCESILPEAANTSVQFHLQVTPATFPLYWNAAQAIAGVQVALGANSPFLFGRRLWDETRIALFEQATDTRPIEMRNQGVRPRVWFGERWITSIFDLFEENVRYFPALLPICDDEDPDAVARAGGVPRLAELRLHNGTVYRWNRPVYDITAGVPHLRVENRVLPAGPTVVDMLANAAFYFGVTRALADSDRPVWTQLPYAAAEQNFFLAAREGLSATLFWPRLGEIGVTDLVLERLLPAAHDGLDRFNVEPAVRDRLLGIIEQRCLTGRNGAVWQAAMVSRLEECGMDRPTALREMLLRYIKLMHTNEPVHSWPVD